MFGWCLLFEKRLNCVERIWGNVCDLGIQVAQRFVGRRHLGGGAALLGRYVQRQLGENGVHDMNWFIWTIRRNERRRFGRLKLQFDGVQLNCGWVWLMRMMLLNFRTGGFDWNVERMMMIGCWIDFRVPNR